MANEKTTRISRDSQSAADRAKLYARQFNKCNTDELDDVVRKACRWFAYGVREPEAVAALDSARKSDKIQFLLGFEPVDAPRGLIDFFKKCVSTGIIEAPRSLAEPDAAAPAAPARRPREVETAARERGGAREPAERTPRAPRTPRTALSATQNAQHFEVQIAGRPQVIVDALGFRKTVGQEEQTVISTRAAYQVVADSEGVRVENIAAPDLHRATRFLRKRLIDSPAILRKALIFITGGGDVFPEDLIARAHIHATSKGYHIQPME